MFRDILNKFTGWQLTLIAMTAILVPGTVAAAVTFQSIVIVDPGNGAQSHIDNNHRLAVLDAVAAYTNNPATAVNITDFSVAATGFHSIYTVPAGKILMIKSISWSYFSNTDGTNNFAYLYDGSANILYNFEGLRVAESMTAALNPGIVVRAGALKLQYFGASTSASRVYVQGNLVPASAVPAAATAEAAQQFVVSGRAGGQGQQLH